MDVSEAVEVEEEDVEEDVEEVAEEDEGAYEAPASDPSSAQRARSPCRRSRAAFYDLLPEPLVMPPSGETMTLEAQLLDITYRDYRLPTVDVSDPEVLSDPRRFAQACVEEVDRTPDSSLNLDLHLVDGEGRSIVATVSTGFSPTVSFVYSKGDAKMTKESAKELHELLATRLGVHGDALRPTQLRQASLVGFDPLGTDPLRRRTYDVVRFAFDTNDLATRAKRMQRLVKEELSFDVADPRCDVVVNFLIDRDLEACGWVTLRNVRPVPATHRAFSSQVEVQCRASDVAASPRRGLAPLMVASYDIETYGSLGAGKMPDADLAGDYIFAITTCLWRAGTTERFNVVMIVGETHEAHGSDTAVECYATEQDLLAAWGALLRRLDCKVLTGYNIYRFDNGYVSKRAHRIPNDRSFWHFNGPLALPVADKAFKLESAAYGQNEGHTFEIRGKVVLDAMQFIQMNYKLPLYNLNFVSGHFLKNHKTDLDIPTMFRHVEERNFDPIIEYVKRDGELVQELLANRDIINSVWEMSRATSTFPQDVLTRGQQIRVMNRLRRICASRNVAIRPPPESRKRRFVGARVVDPNKGFYQDPVITLDFASLYPSIIRSYNICYQTWIDPHAIARVRERFPNLEIVEHTLLLGQVWEEGGAGSGAEEIPPAASGKLMDVMLKQFKKGYVDVALTEDEYEALVAKPILPTLAGGTLTTRHVVAFRDPETQHLRRFRPKAVAHYFAKGVARPDGGEDRCPSLLPDVLEDLGKLRKKAKKAMATAEADATACGKEAEAAAAAGDAEGEAAAWKRKQTATELAKLFDGEQQAYKVVMNSVYGFTAADTLRLLALAETVTAKGREALADSIRIAEGICADMGFEGSKVVYGDTDSIFVHVKGATSAEALDVGAVISQACNAHFEEKTKSPHLVLEFEALFDGILLCGKKCYAGHQHAVFEERTTVTRTYHGKAYTFPAHGMSRTPKKYKKGMRAVRRDTPPFVAQIQGESIDVLLETKSVPAVLEYLRRGLMRLIQLEVPRDQFRITMQLKRAEDYHKSPEDAIAKQPHLRLVAKLRERSEAGALPQGCVIWGVGERVPFFYAETDALLACDRAEDLIFAEAHDIPPDRIHYFDLSLKALEQSLTILSEVKGLVTELEREHIAGLRSALQRRRKLAVERQRHEARGQRSLLSFDCYDAAAPSAAKRPPPHTPRPPAKKPTGASITKFFGY